MKKLIALILLPAIAVASTSYDLAFRHTTRSTSAPHVSRRVVQDDTVGMDPVENPALSAVDNTSRTVHSDSNPTPDPTLVRLPDEVRQLSAKSTTAPADHRANAEPGAEFLQDQTQLSAPDSSTSPLGFTPSAPDSRTR